MLSKEHEPPIFAPILQDNLYIECIGLAQLSKSSKQRYGSLMVKDGEILGYGYNRSVAHPSFGKLERVIYQGYSNHAEIEALNDALSNGKNVQGAEIYVGGYFPKINNLLFLKNEYTCLRSLPILEKFNISKINVPAPTGWIVKNLDESYIDAKKYLNGTYNNRLLSAMGNWTLSDLSLP